MNWEFHTFQTLDTRELFDVMKLRTDVLVVEQQCAYPELDDLDTLPTTLPLLGFDQQVLSAYARAMLMNAPSTGPELDAIETRNAYACQNNE